VSRGFRTSINFAGQSHLSQEGIDVKIRTLASIALALAILAAAGLWTLTTLLPRVRPKSALEKAAVSGSPEELRREVRLLGGGVNGMDGHGFTVLDWAARTGRVDAIHELVHAGADPNLRDLGPNQWTPLLHAVHKGQLGSVRALIADGAEVDGANPKGITPLMLACSQGEAEIVDELLARGADPYLKQRGDETALTYAMTDGNRRVIRALLRKAPDLRLTGSWEGVVARLLARMRGQSDILAQLNRPAKPGKPAETAR
jgi:ankyrin repeat protein